MKRVWPAALLFATGLAAHAQDGPFVTVDVIPEEVSVGEPIRLRVTVLGPTWFPKPPVFPSFEIANAVVRLPPNSSRPTARNIGRDRWTGIARNYEVFPLIGANFALDGLTMQVTYANPGAEPITVNVDVPEISFRSTVPPGAEDLDPYIAGRSLTLSRAIDGETASLEAGDAVVVNYTAELDGLPAIFLPSLFDVAETPGVSAYVDAPEVEDGPPARRTEKATFVFEAGGEYELPAAELRWWNTEANVIEIASVGALGVSVTGPSLPTAPQEEAPVERNWLAIAGLIIAALILIRIAVRSGRALNARWKAYRARVVESEEYAFLELRKTLHAGDAYAAYAGIVHWLDRLEPGSEIREFASEYGDSELIAQLEDLSNSLYADGSRAVDLDRLGHLLAKARKHYETQSAAIDEAHLPPLNP